MDLRAFALSMSRPAPPVELVDPERHGVCSECGKTVRVVRTSAPPERRRCRECQRANPRPRTGGRSGQRRVDPTPRVCALCEKSYVPKPGHRPDQRFCSKPCTTAWRNGARPPYERPLVTGMAPRVSLARERRLRHAQTWDGITDKEILERDGWRCQIPGCKRRPIRKDLKYPHMRSKSIDHIVPLSHGGDDTAVNKRAAHLDCNISRGSQMGEEQVALFGVIREPPLVTRTHNGATVKPPKPPRLCGCGAKAMKGRRFCQACLDRRAAEVAGRPGPASLVRYYVCRYCGELKVAHGTNGQRREVCPARPCQLARRAANNLRVRHGVTADEANAQMAGIVASATGNGYGRWQAVSPHGTSRSATHICPGCGERTTRHRWCDDCLCTSVNTKGRRCGNLWLIGGKCDYHAEQDGQRVTDRDHAGSH